MIELTQTSLYPRGNCWQTAVACLLELPIERLPSQADAYVEVEHDGRPHWACRYNNPLQVYLKKHHGLAYVEFHQPEEALAQLGIRGYHLMTGITVRSDRQDGQRHVVVGCGGALAWDPHPSRAGLLGDIRWAVLCPWPRSWRSWDDERCVCPACAAVSP